MNHRKFKSEINEQFARIARAVANAHRIELIDLLAQGERSVEELARESDLTIASASQHLGVLREAHLVTTRKAGLHVFYKLADPQAYSLIQTIRALAERQLAEVDRIVDAFLHERETLEPVTIIDLATRLNDPGLVILDVRPTLEYGHGHIAGARSIPVGELETRLHELSPEQEIIAYCRGAYCVFADEAVSLLSERGYHVRRLQEGYPDWHIAGLPTEMTH